MNNFNASFIFVMIIIILLFAIFNVIMNLVDNKNTNYVEVEATVISVSEKRASGSRAGRTMVYQPTFSYEWNGFVRTVESPTWASFYNFKVGDKVKLLVDPEDGSNFKFKNSSLNPANFILRTMVFFIIVAIIMTIINKNK